MNSKITSLARTVALLAIISGFAFLIWDVIKGCTCHCNWIFGLLLLASIILFILWVRDMIGSDNEENQREHEAISKSGGYSKPTSSSTYEPDTKAPEAKITEASIKKAAPKAKTAKVELSEEDKAAKLEVLKNIIGVANGQDDLKKVLGIGPVYEKKLHTMGIKTFEQLAKLTPEAVEAVEQLTNFPGRVGREDWIGQAKKLMNS